MVDSIFVRYERTVLDVHQQLDSLLENGDAKPLLLWHVLLAMVLPFCALLIPHQPKGWIFRPVLSAIALSISVETIGYRRALLGANGYIVGLTMVWWLVWSSTLLFFNDAERNFERIERVQSRGSQDTGSQQNGHASNKADKPSEGLGQSDVLVWQPYPRSILHRLGWTLALVLTMRGPDFNFRISSLDPLPPQLKHQNVPVNDKWVCPQAKTRIQAAFIRFFVAYLVIDILKLTMIWDPYFMGIISAPPPFPLNHLSTIPGLIRLYRSLLSGTAVYFALQFVTALNPMFFLGLSTAFPSVFRAITATPLDASWLYADQFGPLNAVLDEGLTGTWGKWWHQIFRFGFVSTGKWILSFLPSALSSRRSVRRTIITVVAFGTSGAIHGFGSFTQISDETRPVTETFLFFILQPVGMFIQDIWSRAVVGQLKRNGLPPPRWLRRIGNAAFVIAWLLFSGNRIADDFAKGGMWLTEPLPISPIRGLMGQGWNCWQTPWFEHYDDGTFWGSGVRVI